MTITLRGVGANGTGTSSVSVAAPTGGSAPQAGDVLIAFILDHSTTDGQSTAPTGWQARGYTRNAGGRRFQVFSGVFGQNSLAGTSWSFTGLTTRSQGMCIVYYGANKTGYGGLDTSVSVRDNASGTYGTLSITTITDGAMILAAFGSYVAASTYSWTNENCATIGALTEEFDNKNSTYCSIAVADKLLATAGPTGASTATPTSGQNNGGILLALKPLVIIEGTVSGSGIGAGGSVSLLNALATSGASGSGLGSSVGNLDILGQFQASGAGQASSLAILDILAQAQASGIGSALATGDVILPFEIVEGQAPGSGMGLASSQGIVNILAEVAGSGEGMSTSMAYLIALACALGSGVGQSAADGWLIIPASASGGGVGLSEVLTYLEATGQAYGEGVGLGSALGDIVGLYYGVLKMWDGGAWVKAPLKVYLAGSWQAKPVKRWNGSEWKEIDTTGT